MSAVCMNSMYCTMLFGSAVDDGRQRNRLCARRQTASNLSKVAKKWSWPDSSPGRQLRIDQASMIWL
jgi:hypothetical protein